LSKGEKVSKSKKMKMKERLPDGAKERTKTRIPRPESNGNKAEEIPEETQPSEQPVTVEGE